MREQEVDEEKPHSVQLVARPVRAGICRHLANYRKRPLLDSSGKPTPAAETL
jgi:hypothetical protein